MRLEWKELDVQVRKFGTALITVVALSIGCGGGGGAEGGAAGAGEGGQGATTVTVSSTEQRTARPLQAGRYRLVLSAPGCKSTTVAVTQENGDFRFEKKRPTFLTMFVSNLPNGTFFIEQTDPSCKQWSITMDRVTG